LIRADEPWWNTHYPPNGWKCHCTVRALSEKMAKRMGLTVSSAPLLNARPWLNKRTGQTLWVPEGIDPGFAYNPGKAWQEGLAPPIGSRFKAEDAGSVARPSVPPQKPAPSPAPVAHKPEQEETHLVPVPDRHRDDARRAAFTHLRTAVQAAVRENNEGALKKLGTRTIDIGVLPQELADALGAKTRKVLLSGATIRKQDQPDKHPELTADDYARIPDLLKNPLIVARSRDLHLMLIGIAGRLYRAIVKVTADREEMFLQSFHRTTPDKARRDLRGLALVQGEPEKLDSDAPGGPSGNPP
ncbi:MAG: hypothetical protein ABF513_05805, partial [Acetobacter malorum]